MLHDAGAPRGRTWEHPPEHVGFRAGTILVAVASSLVTLLTILVLLPGLGSPLRPLVGPGLGPGTSIEAPAPPEGALPSIAEIYQAAAPAVVRVDVTRGVLNQQGNGSGFVIADDGLIVTNHHVIKGARRIQVHLGDGRALAAELVGRDPATDLALISVQPEAPLPTLRLGRTEGLAVGAVVLTIGSPFGFDQTLSAGHVSALGRSIKADDDWGTAIDEVIQTDAALNPGNSGGPLLDARGRVVGITSAIFSTSGHSAGVGFAIPVEVLRGVLPELLARGYVQRPYLGARGVNVSPRMATMLSLPADEGVLVQSVAEGSPAERAGLRAGDTHLPFAEGNGLTLGGDLIVAVDGRSVGDVAELNRRISSRAIGDAVRISVLRDGEHVELRGILAASQPPD